MIASDQVNGIWIHTTQDADGYRTTTFWDYALVDHPHNPSVQYATEAEALAGHARAVSDVRDGKTPWFSRDGGLD